MMEGEGGKWETGGRKGKEKGEEGEGKGEMEKERERGGGRREGRVI